MENLHISSPESTHILNQMSADAPQTDPDQEARKVHFDLPESFTPSDFLSCFQFQPNLSENEPSRHRSINVADSISQEKKVGLGKTMPCRIFCLKGNTWYWHCIDSIYQNYFFLTGKFLFSQCISPEGSADSLATVIQNCNISPNLLLVSFLIVKDPHWWGLAYRLIW